MKMADQQDPARPSFVSFWKRSKDVITGRTITFVPSGSNPNETCTFERFFSSINLLLFQPHQFPFSLADNCPTRQSKVGGRAGSAWLG